jgi:S1-C subfamily serine protease
VRDEINATGPDIYHRSEVTRDVYSLYADVEPGNSGGPLLTTKGDVYGVIFAKSLDDSATGYALTAKEARPVVRQVSAATARVDTDTCA